MRFGSFSYSIRILRSLSSQIDGLIDSRKDIISRSTLTIERQELQLLRTLRISVKWKVSGTSASCICSRIS